MDGRTRSYAADLLNNPLEPDSPDERRLARAITLALRDEVQGALSVAIDQFVDPKGVNEHLRCLYNLPGAP